MERVLPGGVKARLDVFNVFNQTFTRDRTLFRGSRAIGDVRAVEVRERQGGTTIQFSLSGRF